MSRILVMGDKAGERSEDTGLLTRSEIQVIERNATRGRPITPEERARSIGMLTDSITHPKASRRAKIAAARALTALEALDLRDLHHTERLQQESGILDLRMRRAEAGKPNDCISVQIAPSEVLPLPAALAAHTCRIIAPTKN